VREIVSNKEVCRGIMFKRGLLRDGEAAELKDSYAWARARMRLEVSPIGALTAQWERRARRVRRSGLIAQCAVLVGAVVGLVIELADLERYVAASLYCLYILLCVLLKNNTVSSNIGYLGRETATRA
jgi:hypothetical protein